MTEDLRAASPFNALSYGNKFNIFKIIIYLNNQIKESEKYTILTAAKPDNLLSPIESSVTLRNVLWLQFSVA